MIPGDAHHNKLEMAAEREAWERDQEDALVASDEEVGRIDELGLGREPSAAGGPGHEETYWLRQKLHAAVTHLRDIEDFYRVRGGSPESFNLVRADRARALYEQIIADFIEGKMTRPMRIELLEEALRRIKPLTDPDLEPFDTDKRKQLLAMRDRASEAWVLAASALDNEPLPAPREKRGQ